MFKISKLILFSGTLLFMIACDNNSSVQKTNQSTSNSSVQKTNQSTSINSQNEYNSWFDLKGKYVEQFNLLIEKVKTGERPRDFEQLVISLVENKTDEDRGGYFRIEKYISFTNSEYYYFSVEDMSEIIETLENILSQTKNDIVKYGCTRRYNTSFGTTITFDYSGTENKWENVNIYYYSGNPTSIDVNYLNNYIQGLKNCKQRILDFKNGKLNNNE